MDCVRVAVHTEAFWRHIAWRDGLAVLDLVTRVCKTLRSECDLAFAVRAMGRNRRIKKMWARRWLGLDGVWLLRVRDLTLAVALAEVHGRGGVGRTACHAVAYRAKDVKYARRHAIIKRDRERWAWLQSWMAARVGSAP
jgi:hypothetical protein